MRGRAPAGALAVLVLVALLAAAACGGASSTAQQREDLDRVAAAIKAADAAGMAVHMDEKWTITGGSVPAGKQEVLTISADGFAREGRVRLAFHVPGTSTRADYDMVITSTQAFARPRGAPDTAWKRTPVAAATALYPALRLELVREAVLLARSTQGSSIANTPRGFSREFKVTPGADQLEQLQSVGITGTAEAKFLKTARAEVDAYLSIQGDQLTRLAVHLVGTAPDSGETNTIVSTADFKASRGAPIEVPAGAQLVTPGQLLSQ